MPALKLKPIEERDPYAAVVLASFDELNDAQRAHELINDERTVAATTTAARWVRIRGGDRIAQENAAIAAKRMLQSGCSAASAVEAGYKSGMRTHNNPLLRVQAV